MSRSSELIEYRAICLNDIISNLPVKLPYMKVAMQYPETKAMSQITFSTTIVHGWDGDVTDVWDE